MRSFSAILLCTVLLASILTAQKTKQPASPSTKKDKSALNTQQERVSYLIGYDVGSNLKNDFTKREIQITIDLFVRGLTDAFAGSTIAVPETLIQATMMTFQNELRVKQEKQTAEMQKSADETKKAGESWLAQNMTKDSVVTLPSGLQYKILVDGSGKSPADTSTVVTHYRGTLIDGTEFDNSYSRGEPAEFPVKGVIKGWTEALQLMKEGSKWMLFIPSNLGYGERGAGQKIPPHAVLVFEIELLKIK